MVDKPERKEFKKKPEHSGKPAASAPKPQESENFRGIVRIAGKDLDGHFSLYKGLLRVRGIGLTLAKNLERVIRKELNLPQKTRCGDLTEEQIERVDEILRAPEKHGAPWFTLNRAKDAESGFSHHVLMADLSFANRQDLQKEKDLRSWRGWRHSIGQRVRGQHNRTTGRTGATMGVLRKAIKEQKQAAAASAQAGGDKGAKK